MKTNPLGDVQAERDHEMLNQAFYETPEYLSLIEEYTRRVVVGRRGTGKSALFYKLEQHWLLDKKTSIIKISPSETDLIGLRPFIKIFGEKPSYLRAACLLSWQYAIILEIISTFANNYKIRSAQGFTDFVPLAKAWRKKGDSITSRLFNVLDEKIDTSIPVEKRIASLAKTLQINELNDKVIKALDLSKYSFQIVADGLDEGYEPDPVGVSILTGLIYAFEKLARVLPKTATTVFLRDNIFRAIQMHDPDYSRNIEGDVLRLHWDEYHLFNMICKRLKLVFSVTQEKNIKVWNQFTARDLAGNEGFRHCLRLTLYRPRDLLVLLNSALNNARSHGRDTIVNEDIEVMSRQISCTRLDDLNKEYREVVPGIAHLISLFSSTKSELGFSEIESMVNEFLVGKEFAVAEAQTLALLSSAKEKIHVLYSVGFLGIWKASGSSFVFCHDGKDPDFTIDSKSKFLVHPCYWIALNLSNEIILEKIGEIHDEYDIQVQSETTEIRNQRLGKIINDLNGIEEGISDAIEFEVWCLQAIKIVFAKGIANAELHPNQNMSQRRDIVGRNTGSTSAWKRILSDYRSRQVVFEVKNYSRDLGSDEYRQMLSYLSAKNGDLGFIINRSKITQPQGKELEWVREMYHEHKKVIIKLSSCEIVRWLSKLRNPQKHDVPDKGIESLLDQYERLYLKLGGNKGSRKK